MVGKEGRARHSIDKEDTAVMVEKKGRVYCWEGGYTAAMMRRRESSGKEGRVHYSSGEREEGTL